MSAQNRWPGAWYDVRDVARMIGADPEKDIEQLLSLIGEDDKHHAKDEQGNPITLVSSRWLFGEKEAISRDLESLVRAKEGI